MRSATAHWILTLRYDVRNQDRGWIKLPHEKEALPNHPHVELVAACEYTYYYGVLCIEWDENIAYRKGCGLIEKNMWDRHDTKYVDLILG